MVFYKQLVGFPLDTRAVPRTAGSLQMLFVSALLIFCASWRGQRCCNPSMGLFREVRFDYHELGQDFGELGFCLLSFSLC